MCLKETSITHLDRLSLAIDLQSHAFFEVVEGVSVLLPQIVGSRAREMVWNRDRGFPFSGLSLFEYQLETEEVLMEMLNSVIE